MSWWDPVSWWNDATKTATGVASTIENWTKQAITKAVGLVENDIKDAITYSEELATDARSWATELYGDAQRDVTAVLGQAEGLFNRVEADARSWVGAAVNDAEGLFNRVEHDVVAGLATVLGDAEGLFNRAEHDAQGWVASVLGEAENLFNRVEADAKGWFDTAEKWATSEATRLANDAYSLIVKDFVTPFLDVWKVCVKALEWLTWMAEHPFAALHDVETDVVDWTRQLPSDLAGALGSADGKGVLEAVTSWLG